jgi:CHASE3 domain sensor protein
MTLKDIKVGTKLITGFMVVALIVVIVGVTGIYNIQKMGKAADIMMEVEMPLRHNGRVPASGGTG